MFDKDLEQNMQDQDSMIDQKLPYLTSSTHQNSSSIKSQAYPITNQCLLEPFSTSLDQEMNANHARIIKQVIFCFFNQCLNWSQKGSNDYLQKESVNFRVINPTLCEEETILDSLVQSNSYLDHLQKTRLLQNFAEFQEFYGLAEKLRELLGRQITQQVIYIMTTLLDQKLQFFRPMILRATDSLLPIIEPFWGNDNDQNFLKGVYEIAEDIKYEQIIQFASFGVEDLAMKIYFSGKLRCLTLREVNCELKQGINIADCFAFLVGELSQSLFLSLIGIAKKEKVFSKK